MQARVRIGQRFIQSQLAICRIQVVLKSEKGIPDQRAAQFRCCMAWDDEASVWSGHCDDIPAAADAATLDELLTKISATAPDLLPDNHPEVDPALFLQITALREAEPVRKRGSVALLKSMKPLNSSFLEINDPVPPPSPS